MRRKTLGVILQLLLFVPFTAQTSEERHNYVVSGRVIDDRGQPVKGARVLVFPPEPPGGWKGHDLLVVDVRTDNEGKFRYEREGTIPFEGQSILYITSPYPANALTPIVPPFGAATRIDKAFSGQPVRVSTREETNVGDVPVQVRFGVVIIYLQDRKGEPMFTGAEDWEYIGIRVRDLNGRIVVQRNVSPASVREAVRVKESAIALALPDGAWRIEIAPDGLKQTWPYDLKEPVLVTEMLLVKASNSPLEVTLRQGSNR